MCVYLLYIKVPFAFWRGSILVCFSRGLVQVRFQKGSLLRVLMCWELQDLLKDGQGRHHSGVLARCNPKPYHALGFLKTLGMFRDI